MSANTQDDGPGFLGTAAAAARLGRSPRWLASERSQGRGPRYIQMGARITYRPEDVDEFLAGCMVTPARSIESK